MRGGNRKLCGLQRTYGLKIIKRQTTRIFGACVINTRVNALESCDVKQKHLALLRISQMLIAIRSSKNLNFLFESR